MPALMTYQIVDRVYASEPTTNRGSIEQLALACLHFGPSDSLDATVIETRYNVVRSNVPHAVAAVRQLRDYLPASELNYLRTGGVTSHPPRTAEPDPEIVVGPW